MNVPVADARSASRVSARAGRATFITRWDAGSPAAITLTCCLIRALVSPTAVMNGLTPTRKSRTCTAGCERGPVATILLPDLPPGEFNGLEGVARRILGEGAQELRVVMTLQPVAFTQNMLNPVDPYSLGLRIKHVEALDGFDDKVARALINSRHEKRMGNNVVEFGSVLDAEPTDEDLEELEELLSAEDLEAMDEPDEEA